MNKLDSETYKEFQQFQQFKKLKKGEGSQQELIEVQESQLFGIFKRILRGEGKKEELENFSEFEEYEEFEFFEELEMFEELKRLENLKRNEKSQGIEVKGTLELSTNFLLIENKSLDSTQIEAENVEKKSLSCMNLIEKKSIKRLNCEDEIFLSEDEENGKMDNVSKGIVNLERCFKKKQSDGNTISIKGDGEIKLSNKDETKEENKWIQNNKLSDKLINKVMKKFHEIHQANIFEGLDDKIIIRAIAGSIDLLIGKLNKDYTEKNDEELLTLLKLPKATLKKRLQNWIKERVLKGKSNKK